MSSHPTPATGTVLVAFDGAHCDRIRKTLGVRIRFLELLRHLVREGEIARPVYHRDLRDHSEAERQEKLLAFLDAHGFEMHGSLPGDMGPGPRERYGTNLVELAVDLLETSRTVGRVVLVAGDRKLLPLVRAIRAHNVPVTVATVLDLPAAIRASDDLLSAADEVFDMADAIRETAEPFASLH